MEYFLLADNVQQGPFTVEELKERLVTPDTLVWRSGLPNWVKASALPELNGVVYTVPPPQPQEEEPPMPKTWLVESILVTVLCCLPCGVVGIVYAARVEGMFLNKQYKEALESSHKARMWTLVGFGVGVGVMILYVAFLLLYAFFG